jgi:hypothetical protein
VPVSNQAPSHESECGSGCIGPRFFLSWHYFEVSGQLYAPADLTPIERFPSSFWIGGCVESRAGMGFMEKRTFLNLPGLELRFLGRFAYFLNKRFIMCAPFLGRTLYSYRFKIYMKISISNYFWIYLFRNISF